MVDRSGNLAFPILKSSLDEPAIRPAVHSTFIYIYIYIFFFSLHLLHLLQDHQIKGDYILIHILILVVINLVHACMHGATNETCMQTLNPK